MLSPGHPAQAPRAWLCRRATARSSRPTKPLRPGRQLSGAGLRPAPERQGRLAGTWAPTTSSSRRTSLLMRVPLRGTSGRPGGPGDRSAARPQRPDPLERLRHRSPGAGIVWPSGFGGQQDGKARDAWPTRPTASSMRSPSSSGARQSRRTTSCRRSRTREAGTTYDERPPQSPRTRSTTFVFGSRQGYCQEFSGATALPAAHGRASRRGSQSGFRAWDL